MTYNFKNIHKFLKLHHKGGVRCCVENTAFFKCFYRQRPNFGKIIGYWTNM